MDTSRYYLEAGKGYVKFGTTASISRQYLGCMTCGAPQHDNHEWTLNEDELPLLETLAIDSPAVRHTKPAILAHEFTRCPAVVVKLPL